MDGALTRRRMLKAAAASGLSLYAADSLLVAQASSRRRAPLAAGGAFDLGVMSGDPTHRAVTLWTRLAGVERDLVKVRLEVAKDPEFRNLVLSSLVPTALRRDHTVKVRVGGLKPDERYFFRFETRGAASPVGRTQTAPAPDSRRPVKFGFFSCQDWVSGYYGAYRRLLAEDPDFVVCLGDYIYERIFYPVYRPDTIGRDGDGEARTLEEYRQKYRLYRSDPNLQELHRNVPFIAMWDDHEVEDNYAGGDPSSDDYDRPRQLNGWRAFFEYQPNLQFIERRRTYRHLRYGRHVDMLLLDERQYRDDQPCGDAFAKPCPDSARPGRKFLGPVQMGWLKDRLQRSDASWKVVGNQLMIMPLDLAGGVPVVQDSWEGYQDERNDLLSTIARKGIKDVAFITGDIHTFFAGQVRERGRTGADVAVELVGGSTTSPGAAQLVSEQSGGTISPDEAQRIADNLQSTNPWFSYVESRSHGYATVEADAKELRAAFWASRDVTTREGSADVRRLQGFRVARGVPKLELT